MKNNKLSLKALKQELELIKAHKLIEDSRRNAK